MTLQVALQRGALPTWPAAAAQCGCGNAAARFLVRQLGCTHLEGFRAEASLRVRPCSMCSAIDQSASKGAVFSRITDICNWDSIHAVSRQTELRLWQVGWSRWLKAAAAAAVPQRWTTRAASGCATALCGATACSGRPGESHGLQCVCFFRPALKQTWLSTRTMTRRHPCTSEEPLPAAR